MISGLSSKTSEQKHGFLQFSKKLDYGLFLLIELTRKQEDATVLAVEPLSLRTMARKNDMSFFFMQKAAFELRRAGLVKADRGKKGGYILAKPAHEITLKEIIEILEGPMTVMHCLVPAVNSLCSRQPVCQMRHGLGAVSQEIVDIFRRTTLDHLLHPIWKQAA